MEGKDSAAADLEGIRPPQQARSRRTLNRIAQAALALLAERGAAGTTVQDIVDRAGSSVGSFYARFDGKEDLLRYLDERRWREARERWEHALAGAEPAASGLEGAVEVVLRLLEDLHAGGGPAPVDAALAGEGPSEGLLAFRTRVRSDVRDLLLAHRDRIDHPDPEAAVDFLVRVLEATIAILTPRDSAEDLQRLALGYLGRARRRGQRDGGVDFFDVWG